MLSYILAALCGLALLGADQYTKYLVVQNFAHEGDSKGFIDGLLEFLYVRNGGGAWGMLKDKTWILISITVVIMLVCIALLIKKGTKNKLMFWAITLILCGGVGNLIDRIFRGGLVVDFLHVQFMDFPVFNVADCGIVIGAGLLLLYFVIDMIKDSRKKHEAVLPEAQDHDENT